MGRILFENAAVVTGKPGEIITPGSVAVSGAVILEVSEGKIAGAFDETIDCRGKTLMPGLVTPIPTFP